MSQDDLTGSTRRTFLGSATAAATALTLASSAGAEQTPIAGAKPNLTQLAQLKTSAAAAPASAPQPTDWTKPAAMAIPKEGYSNLNREGTARSTRGLRQIMVSRSSQKLSPGERRRSE